jgi:sugar phosphate isomerase/epimerase
MSEGVTGSHRHIKSGSAIVDKESSNTRGIALGGTARSPDDVAMLYDLGLDFAEVSLKDMSSFTKSISDFTELRSKTNLFYLCHGPNEGDPNDTAYLREHYLPSILEILDIMPMLNMSLLTLHLWVDHRFVKPHVINLKIELLEQIIEKAGKSDIKICLENLSEDCKDLDKVFKALSQLYLTLDVGHAQLLRSKTTAFDLITAYPHRIKHLHLHDNLGGNSVDDDLHLPVGDGNVDFCGILGALKEAGYRGTATLELKPEEIKRCLAFVRTFLW